MSGSVEKEIDGLVLLGDRLVAEASRAGEQLGAASVETLFAVSARGGQLIRRLYGTESQYNESFQAALATPNFSLMHARYYRHVTAVVGILKAVQHEIRSGLLTDLRQLMRAEIFADFLEMAEHLLEQGYKDASAVLLGAVLEDALRKNSVARGLPTTAPNGKPLTIDPLNVAAAKDGAYGPLVQKQVTSWANLRNDAAHGDFAKYDKTQVQHMLLFVQKFCADYVR